MKKLSSNRMVGIVAIFLCFTMISIGLFSIQINMNLQGNARVINYTGIVRGGTQKLIKQELNHQRNDALIVELDDHLEGLLHGDKKKNIIYLEVEEYQNILKKMEVEWAKIKTEIYRFRNGEDSQLLYDLSERYFVLADEAVCAAEEYTEEIVQQSRRLMIMLISTFIIVVILSTYFIYKHNERKKRILQIEKENKKRSEQLTRQSQEMLAPINEMTELLYIADIHTYDLLFVNNTGKKLFHLDNIQGLKCYKALQGFDHPCEFCTNKKLSKDETYTWEYTNPIIKGHYLLKDRLIDWEGHTARMEIAFDITESLIKKKELEDKIKRDNILVDCIRELYQNHNTVDAMNRVLKLIGELFEAERAYVFYMENDEMSNIAEWCKEGIVPEIDNLQHLPRNDFKWWFKLYDEQSSILIKDVEELQGDRQAEYELLSNQKIKRLVLVPFEHYGNFGGMIGLDNLNVHVFENAEKFLRTFSYFVMLSIRRNEDEKTLFELSYQDSLTMFYNRNRFMQDVEHISKLKISVGVAYIDLNGLKEVNDDFGHDAGDALLQTCANIIKNRVCDGTLYRIGGDEFVIICVNIKEEEFKKLLENLKVDLSGDSCNAAVGYQWTANSEMLHEIIKKADQYMYEDKKKFYQKNSVTGRYRY